MGGGGKGVPLKFPASLLSLPLRAAADIRPDAFCAGTRLRPSGSCCRVCRRRLRAPVLDTGTASMNSHDNRLMRATALTACRSVPIANSGMTGFHLPILLHLKGSSCACRIIRGLGLVPWLCETSGTTAPTKFIPFTHEMFRMNRRAALDMLCCYLAARPGSRIPSGKILYMAGSTQLKQMGAGVSGRRHERHYAAAASGLAEPVCGTA